MSQQQAKPSTPKSQQQQGEKSVQKPRQNNNNVNGNKQDNTQKPFRGTGRTSRGGSRGGSSSGKRNFSKQNSKTVFVGRIFFDDLYTHNITTSLADKLKDQRIRLLKEVFASFGTIEAIESHFNTDDNSYMLVTYETTEDAKNAYQTMRSKDKVAEEMDKIRGRLSQQKQFPPNVCPELFEYRYDMSDKPANAKSAGKNKNVPKTVIAGANPLQAVQQTVTANAQQPQQEQATQPAKNNNNNKKARKEKKNEEEASEKPAPKKEQKQPPQKKQQGSGDLQREAEKAKLKEELKYLQNQQTHVSQEIAAEKSRAKERDERILKLSTELARVREEEQMLQNKLNAENNYRSDAEHRIQKLREELSHMHQEEQLVKQKMSIFEQQEQQQGSQQNGTY